ncbi:MAG: hypothetical protein ACE5HX_07545 [bacterium]
MREVFEICRIILPAVYFLSLLLVLISASAFAQRPPTTPINLSYLRIDFIQPGARPAALGGAFIGAAQDETAAPINPAGLTYLKNAGTSLHQRNVRTSYEEPAGSPTTPNARKRFHTNKFDQNMVSVFIPMSQFTLAIFRQVIFDSRFNFDTPQFLTTNAKLFSRFVLGGLGNFPGRRVNLDLKLVHDAIAVGFTFSKRLSLGLTGKMSVLTFNLDEQTFLDSEVINGSSPRENTAETTYAITTIDARKLKLSYSFGIMAKLIIDKLFVGAVINFNPTFDLKSHIFLPEYKIDSQILSSELPRNTNFHLSVPDTYGFGFYYLAHSRLHFTFDLMRINYSDLLDGNDRNIVADDAFNIQTGNYEDPDSEPDLKVEDVTQLHFGIEYLVKVPKLALIPLRFGVYTQPGHRIYASGNDPDLRRLFPKAKDRVHTTFGLGIVFNSYLKFDGSIDVSADGFELIASTLISVPF